MTESDRVAHQPSNLDQNMPRTSKLLGKSSWRRSRYAKLGLRFMAALFVFTLIFYWIGGVGRLSINRPFEYSGDSLEVLAKAHNFIANDYDTRLRAPFESSKADGTAYLYDVFFQSNSDLIWIAKLLGGGGTAETLNLAYLLSFLFVFLSAYWACGRLGLRDPFRFCAAALFALMPYHFQRAENHFLESCYYFVPFMATVMVQLWSARPLAFRWTGGHWQPTWRDRRIWFALFLLLFLTSCNPYHQFFFACLVAAVAPFAAMYRENWRPLVVGWGLAIFACAALVLKHMLAQHMSSPELALGLNNQPISTYGSAELYPLKLAQMLLPVQGHRWDVLARLRHMYDASNPLNNENSTTTLGLVGSIGFLLCIALVFVPKAKLRMSRAGKMGLIALMAVLFASMGGFSSIISTISMELQGPRSMLVQARAWDRIVLFIAFFAYFTAFWLLQRWMKTVSPRLFSGRRRSALIWTVGVMVFAFALWDQVPYNVVQQNAGHHRSDVRFFGTLERQLPPDSRVFQLPFVVHHHSGFVLPGVYYTEMLRPYIATKTMHFTYGGDLHSVQTEWLRATSALPADQAARHLCRYGFAGVLLQRNMLKKPAILEGQWQTALEEAPDVSEDGDYSFFDLHSYCRTNGIQAIDMNALKGRLLEQLKDGQRFVSAGAFDHRIGRVILNSENDIVIRADADEHGWLAYGPYASLKPGHYRATFRFAQLNNAAGKSLRLDINAKYHGGRRVLNKLSFHPESSTGVISKALDFRVNSGFTQFEYRVLKSKGIRVDFLGVEIQKVADARDKSTNKMPPTVTASSTEHFRAELALAAQPVLSADGKDIIVTVDITNTGPATFGSSNEPHQVNLGAHSINGAGTIVDNDLARGHLPQIKPGTTEKASIQLPISSTLGFRVELLPVQEYVAWFDQWGTKPLIVGPFRACVHQSAVKVCNASGQPLSRQSKPDNPIAPSLDQ